MLMKTPAAAAFLMAWVLTPLPAQADPFAVTTVLSSSGALFCRSTIPCSGEGTSSLTFDSGDQSATLTFIGLSSTFEVTNRPSPVTLGEFELSASGGFVFPTHPANPELSIVRFVLTMTHSSPTMSMRRQQWLFGPGGEPSLTVLQARQGYVTFPLGPFGNGYTRMVYDMNPFPFTIASNAVTPVTADVGVVPEPATMILFGTGLAGAVLVRRRRRQVTTMATGARSSIV